ncbi:MAG: sigma-70 family RNA polymerase sigma factor [Planctomycetota bacterium]
MTDPAPPTIQALLEQTEWVRRLARRLVGDPHAADDLAQQAMAVALERPPRDGSRLRAWLSQVLANLHRQGLRGAHVETRLEAPDEASLAAPAPDEVVERAEVHHLLVHEVLSLDEPYRTTVLLRYFDALGPREIAERAGVPLATVTSRLTRAHARLRERVERTRTPDGRGGLAALAPLVTPSLPLRATAAHAPSALVLMTASAKIGAAVVLAVSLGVAGFLLSDRRAADVELVDVAQAAAEAPAGLDLDPAAPTPAARSTAETGAPVVAAPEVASTRLAGLVLDASGSPAVGAHVVLGGHGSLLHLLFDDDPEDGVILAITDEDGRFAFDSIPDGVNLVTAGAHDAAPSETSRVELASGEVVDDLTLTLRRGIRIHGEVIRPDGSYAKGRAVRMIQDEESADARGRRLSYVATTDEQGRFDAPHLQPGAWSVVSFPDDEEAAELGGTMPEQMAQATLRLEDGEEKFIALGARSSEAVVVRGRVAYEDDPADGFMQWIGEGDDPIGSQKIAQLDGEGRYEVELPRPGPWYVRVFGDRGHGEYYLDVPTVEAHDLDLALPTAGLSGRIVDASGAAVEGARVSHVLVAGGAHRHALRLADDSDTTGADGAFRFTGLRPGHYQIGVTHPERGAAVASAVEVTEGGAVEGIEIALAAGHAVTGRVMGPTGLAAPKVPIWIHDASGGVVQPITRVVTNDEGRFKTAPLPPGTYSIVAQLGPLVGQALGVVVEADGAKEVEITLAEGATVVVEAQVEGETVRGEVRVTDQDGRLLTGLRCLFDPWTWRRHPFDSRRKHVGPFVAGTYTVTVRVPEVGEKAVEVTLQPGEERRLTIPLGD